MELVLFIILGGYLLLRVGSEKAASYAAKKQADKSRETKSTWVECITDRVLEEELRMFISRPENQSAILDQVTEVYDKILNGKRIDEFYPRELWCKKERKWSHEYHERVQTNICKLNSRNALRIMMARRGHLMRMDAVDGVCQQLNSGSRLETEIIIWCACELERHGLKEKFCILSRPTPGMFGAKMGWEV